MLELDHARLQGRDPFSFALLALSLSACGGAGTNSGNGGTGGTSTAQGQTASHATSATSSKSSGNVTSSTATGSSYVCDPPAAPGSLYEKEATQLVNVDPTSMCEYRGQVLLIFDEAAA
jgi:hypothetical protein